MNEHDLERLVNLLSYLKKHDDVESEIQKRRGERKPPPGQREKTPWERTQSPGTFTSEPLGSTVVDPATARGYSTAAGGSAGAYQTSTSTAEPNFPSSLPDPSTQEIRDRVATTTPPVPGEEEIYVPEEDKEITGPRGGSKGYKSSTPEGQEREVVAPSDPDSSEGVNDWLNDSDTREWLKEKNINSLSELQDYVKNFVPRVAGPGDYSRAPEQVQKSTESILLSLLDRLGI